MVTPGTCCWDRWVQGFGGIVPSPHRLLFVPSPHKLLCEPSPTHTAIFVRVNTNPNPKPRRRACTAAWVPACGPLGVTVGSALIQMTRVTGRGPAARRLRCCGAPMHSTWAMQGEDAASCGCGGGVCQLQLPPQKPRSGLNNRLPLAVALRQLLHLTWATQGDGALPHGGWGQLQLQQKQSLPAPHAPST